MKAKLKRRRAPALMRATVSLAVISLAACSGTPPQGQTVIAAPGTSIAAGSRPISEVPGETRSLQDFCRSHPPGNLPNGQLTLDAVCAPDFIAKNVGATVKTVQASGTPVLMFAAPTKVDAACAPSTFKAPMCRGFRPGDTFPGIPLNY